MRSFAFVLLEVTLCFVWSAVAFGSLSVPVARGDVEERCTLPPETGPCRAAFPRFYYNSTTGKCSTFIYGGCKGNGNNFETKAECSSTCVPSNLEDQKQTNTAAIYRKLIRAGVDPAKPIPFFSPMRKRKRNVAGRQPDFIKAISHDTAALGAGEDDEHHDQGTQSGPGNSHVLENSAVQQRTGHVYLSSSSESQRTTLPHVALKQSATNSSQSGKYLSENAGRGIAKHFDFKDEDELSKGNFPALSTDKLHDIPQGEKHQTLLSGKEGKNATLSSDNRISDEDERSEGKNTTLSSDKRISVDAEPPAQDEKRPLLGKDEDKLSKGNIPALSADKLHDMPQVEKNQTLLSSKDENERLEGTNSTLSSDKRISVDAEPVAREEKTPPLGKDEDKLSKGNIPALSTDKLHDIPQVQKHPTLPSGKDVDERSKGNNSTLSSHKRIYDLETSPSEEKEKARKENEEKKVEALKFDDQRDSMEGRPRGGDLYGQRPSEHQSSHFAAFFLTSIVMVFTMYVIYHNRQKIIAIVIEGRSHGGNGRRRGYRKLETSVEEAMPSMKSANSTYVY